MVLRYQHFQYLRNAVTLWGLTALFVLVRCSVPERDYDRLGIGGGEDVLHGSAGQGGEGGEGGEGGGASGQAGQGGLIEDDAGALGGSGGAPPVPIPCVEAIPDAGSDAGDDAGPSDAGSTVSSPSDASTGDDPCECVDGFIRAVDADGDGDGTRACTVAPGLDCDDGDDSVTHNTCGGCSALPNTVGADCLECGAYVCDGPESVVCASKPSPSLVDPDCRCVDAQILARDTDGDGQGTRLCEESPGIDCNDGDPYYQTNPCGGCEAAPGALGDPCNACGVYACNGNAIVCVPNQPPRCQNDTVRETCVGTGFWSQNTCENACYAGNCEVCLPGTYACTYYAEGDARQICAYSSAFSAIMWVSAGSCLTAPNLRCNPTDGSCTTGQLILPRDETFDVVPLQRGILPWHDLLNTASESDYG